MSDKQIQTDAVVTRGQDLVSRVVDGETVMLSVASGKYYGLDAIGSRVWELIDQPLPVEQLCSTLMQEFEVTRAQCEQDVLAFLNKMALDSLVRVVDDEDA